MSETLITYELDGNVALIGLNRPDKRNSINDPLIDALRAAVLRAHEEADVAVLFGHGTNFCAGLDLAEALARATGQIKPPRKRKRHNWHEVFDLIARGPIPFVAALHGAVVGGGGTVRIQRVVGTTVMMDMMLTGRLLTAAEGLQEKVIRYVTPVGEALTKAKELAHRIAKNSVETNWMIINVLPRIHDMTHDDGLFVEQLNSARARPPEAEARLREFVDGKAKKIQDNQA